MPSLQEVELGGVYRDSVSGFMGVATNYTKYLDDPLVSVDLEAHHADGSRVVNTFPANRLIKDSASSNAGQYL